MMASRRQSSAMWKPATGWILAALVALSGHIAASEYPPPPGPYPSGPVSQATPDAKTMPGPWSAQLPLEPLLPAVAPAPKGTPPSQRYDAGALFGTHRSPPPRGYPPVASSPYPDWPDTAPPTLAPPTDGFSVDFSRQNRPEHARASRPFDATFDSRMPPAYAAPQGSMFDGPHPVQAGGIGSYPAASFDATRPTAPGDVPTGYEPYRASAAPSVEYGQWRPGADAYSEFTPLARPGKPSTPATTSPDAFQFRPADR